MVDCDLREMNLFGYNQTFYNEMFLSLHISFSFPYDVIYCFYAN